MNNYIKSFDTFGHEIALNFNRNGQTHKTLPGGILSLIVYSLFTIFVGIKMKILFQLGDNDLGLSEKLREDLSTVINFGETGTTSYFMPKLKGKRTEIYRKGTAEDQMAEIRRYIKPSFGQ